MRAGKIELRDSRGALVDAAFGLNNDFVPIDAQIFHRFPEALFAFAAAVNIRVVKHIHAAFQRRAKQSLGIFEGLVRNPHTAEDDAGSA